MLVSEYLSKTNVVLDPNKWDKSGLVVEALNYDQYRIKVDGSGRLTLRNRRFLKVFTPMTEYRAP